jgi:hypothetical protein
VRTLIVALIGVVGVLAAAAYGAARQSLDVTHRAPRPAPEHPARKHPGSLPRPRITEHPDSVATSTTARFAFLARGSRPRFTCGLDGARWRRCRTPVEFTGLVPGAHTFAVRTVGRRGRRSKPARFRWTLLEPKAFSIAPRLSGLGPLYPGAAPLPLPLVVTNPNSVPILITSLQVSVSGDPSGCASAENLAFQHAGASSAAPLEVPPGGSVALPATGISAPTIQLRDLAVNQDACQGASFPLEFTGSARG